MSINVTVSGNPVKIHRGKLITCDLQDADKRRKMRIQQVRQQSKELAAAVRNNVKKAKSKQQTEFEKQNQSKLKEWQNKKLLQLQSAYEDNVRDIGAGHAQARISEIEEIQEIERKKIVNQERAARRGQSAQEILQIKKNETSLQKAIPRQAKQIAREVENARAAMIVSQAVRKSPKKKRVTKGNFTIVEHQDDLVPDDNDIDNEADNVQGSQINSQESNKKNEPDNVTVVDTLASVDSLQREEVFSSNKTSTKRFRHSDTSSVSITTIEIPEDTRISDRIRNRQISNRLADIPEAVSAASSTIIEMHETHSENKENARQPTQAFSQTTQQGVSIEPANENQNDVVACPVCIKHNYPRACRDHNMHTCPHTAGNATIPQIYSHPGPQSFEVPHKPTVTVARESYTPQYSAQDTQSSRTEYRRVRSFDRNNRFGHHYITDTSQVERINPEELAYCHHDHDQPGPSHASQRRTREFSRLADERYRSADIRGKQAMRKETVRKDYAELMKRLPLLQKQGRIAEINRNKDKLHMSEARKREHEQQRQLRMEHAFECLAPTITLPMLDDCVPGCEADCAQHAKLPKPTGCQEGCRGDCNASKHAKMQQPSTSCSADCRAECNPRRPKSQQSSFKCLDGCRAECASKRPKSAQPKSSCVDGCRGECSSAKPTSPKPSFVCKEGCQGECNTSKRPTSPRPSTSCKEGCQGECNSKRLKSPPKKSGLDKTDSNASKRPKSPKPALHSQTNTEPIINKSSSMSKKPSTAGKKCTTKTAAAVWKKPHSDVATATSTTTTEANLMTLLEKLRCQKQELMKECKDLPQDSNFYNFIEDLDFVAKSHTNQDKTVQTECSTGRSKKRSPSRQKQVLVLQNTSTQTSPNVKMTVATSCEDASKDSQKRVDSCDKHSKSQKSSRKGVVCSCKDRDKLCEILIKIRDCPAHSSTDTKSSDENLGADVVVTQKKCLDDSMGSNSVKKHSGRKTAHLKSGDSDRSISPKRSRSESPKKSPRKAAATTRPVKPAKVDGSNSRIQSSWMQNFSSSSRNAEEMTSTTSYYSPPDYNQQARQQAPSTSTPCSQLQARGVLPNQGLLTMINKLLEISKDKLNMVAANVSSISDVPTPTASVINMRSNRPQGKNDACLQNQSNDSTYIENLATLLKYFNLTPGDFKSFVSVASASSVVDRTRSSSFGSSNISTTNGKSNGNAESLPQPSLEACVPFCPAEPIVDQFAQWAELCQARINNLTAMIDQVRKEKQVMLSPSGEQMAPIDRSTNATVYMNLPPGSSNASSSGSPSLEQRQLNEEMLNVDGCEKFSGTSGRSESDVNRLLECSKHDPNVDRDMIERYLKLVDVELQAQRAKSPEVRCTEVRVASPPRSPSSSKAVSFKPMLDIPKLPKLQPQGQNISLQPASQKSKKPPVTTNALRFNDVIHELSAIPEVENSRLSKSPQSKNTSPQKRRTPRKSPKKSSKTSTADIGSDSPASEKSTETVESMLKNIGLDWAINTLKIMKETNNNSSSSSSSFDIEQKKFSFMLAKNASTSTEKGASPNEQSRHQRTSTPVQTTNSSKSIPSHRLINSGESDISPVVTAGDGSGRRDANFGTSYDFVEHSFHTLPSQSVCDPENCDC